MKVVIITREREYPSNCKAYELFSKGCVDTGSNIKDYIYNLYKEALKREQKRLKEDAPNPILCNLPIDLNKFKTGYLFSSDDNYAENFFYSEVKSLLDENLKECMPLVHLDNPDSDIKVSFVFMNRIYDCLFPTSIINPAELFVPDDNLRHAFIKTICKDCKIIDKNGVSNDNNNLLFVHDKEFGLQKEELLLFNGNWYNPSFEQKYKVYADYFSSIKVFQHIGGIFNRIKDMTFIFDEEVKEDNILKRKSFFKK